MTALQHVKTALISFVILSIILIFTLLGYIQGRMQQHEEEQASVKVYFQENLALLEKQLQEKQVVETEEGEYVGIIPRMVDEKIAKSLDEFRKDYGIEKPSSQTLFLKSDYKGEFLMKTADFVTFSLKNSGEISISLKDGKVKLTKADLDGASLEFWTHLFNRYAPAKKVFCNE